LLPIIDPNEIEQNRLRRAATVRDLERFLYDAIPIPRNEEYDIGDNRRSAFHVYHMLKAVVAVNG